MTSTPPSRPAPLPPSKRPTPYPHLQDLIDRTHHLKPRDRVSIKSWMDEAERHAHQAQWHKDKGVLDSSLVDYLIAMTIYSEMIPRHPDYPTFYAKKSSPLYEKYLRLRQNLNNKTDEYVQIKDAIRRDNEISGVLSTMDQLNSIGVPSTNGKISPQLPINRKPVPEPRTKPEHLMSKALPAQPDAPADNSNGTTSTLDLRERLARLNTRPKSSTINGIPPSLIPGPPGGIGTVGSGNTGSAGGSRHPMGPREMPSKELALKLDTKKDYSIHQMPAPPAPVYSPSTSYASPGGLSPPRSSRNTAKPDLKPDLPADTDTSLTPKMLASYIKASSYISVFLIDVRVRDEYDQGHIFSRRSICIEPIVLREGISGLELEDALIVGPSLKELELFKTRAQHDLVVYYDKSTADTSYLKMSRHPLAVLHAAITEYSFSKKLRRPPMLLEGGLDAWISVFGEGSLVQTTTEVSKVPSQTNPWRRSKEVRAPTPLLLERRGEISNGTAYPTPTNGDGRPFVPMPKEPINIEEERQWLELFRKESGPVTIAAPMEGGDGKQRRRATSIVSQNTSGSYVRTVEEFFQQYPASPHAHESMSPKSTVEYPPTPRRQNHTIIDHPFHLFTDVRNTEFNPPASPVRPLPVAPRKSYSGVSERLTGGVPAVLPERPPKLPLTNRSVSGTINFNVGTTGLKNLGNTCYMNSILQCMSGTLPLARYFLDGSYKQHINKNNTMGSRGVLAEAFATIIRHLWSGEYNFISPVTFKDVSGRLNDNFRSSDQQDAQEFLAFLLDGLHEDLNPNATKNKLNPLTEEEELRRERFPMQIAAAIEWQRYTHNNSSVAVNWLQGQLASQLKCLTCGTTSTTYSPFMYLSLPIPQISKNFTLRDCLLEFTKQEVLDGDDKWLCSKCKQHRKATKKLTITRLPHILIIHLKRFATHGRWRDKLNTPIGFPLTNLDLTEYVPSPLPKNAPSPVALDSAETNPPFYYDLYGIANHYGTLQGGHYTAFVKNPYKGVWTTFDDSKTTQMDEQSVVSRNAYVLFWVRKGVM